MKRSFSFREPLLLSEPEMIHIWPYADKAVLTREKPAGWLQRMIGRVFRSRRHRGLSSVFAD